jgi:glycosyltransferase involved in cell wall biosynthesis
VSGLRFSVVVPTYNRPAQIAGCLAALSMVEEPEGGFEIVVVNDGGDPIPGDALLAAGCGSMGRVRVLEQRNAGPAAARNAGAQAAAGECLAFTDDDCRPDPGWLRAFDRALRVAPSSLVAGRTYNALTENLWSTTSQSLIDCLTEYFTHANDTLFFASNNIALARDVFVETGGFDSRFATAAAEDREFCDRWHSEERPWALAGDAVVRHAHALTFATFLRQHFAYGRGGARFRTVRRERGRPQPIDLSFYVASLSYPFHREAPTRAFSIAALTVFAHAAYFTGLLTE